MPLQLPGPSRLGDTPEPTEELLRVVRTASPCRHFRWRNFPNSEGHIIMFVVLTILKNIS